MKWRATFLLLLSSLLSYAQGRADGALSGNIQTEGKAGIQGASVSLSPATEANAFNTSADRNGAFEIRGIPPGVYKLRITAIAYQMLVIDSIHFRESRMDFNLPDLVLKEAAVGELAAVVVYRERPLVESTGGNITFNASESALSAGSNASDLLTNVPLITKDATGKVLIRGKEPKILIDDKPVELNQQQLQDLLESLPGSAIEKIEVLTNPPPQFANEAGGVINIVTRKGNVGRTGRLNFSGGTRGEASVTGNFGYRKKGLALTFNGGTGYTEFMGSGHSFRENNYGNFLRLYTRNESRNAAFRPNARLNVDYDISKLQSISVTVAYNDNDFNNNNSTYYSRYLGADSFLNASSRSVQSDGGNRSGSATLTYTLRAKRAGTLFRIIAGTNKGDGHNDRNFYEQFLSEDLSPTGRDSAQLVHTSNRNTGNNLRLNYDRSFKKSTLSTGLFYNAAQSHIGSDASFLRAIDGKWVDLAALTNNLVYYQHLFNYRASWKHVFGTGGTSVTAGASAEKTWVRFRVPISGDAYANDYWNVLPFFTLSKTWKQKWNGSLSYRQTVRRPGVIELTPIKDVSDSTNIRSGNPSLLPAVTHSFDLVLGKTAKQTFINAGLGYNNIQDIYYAIRISPTETSWQNISGKEEFEVSTWSGITLSKRTRLNGSASYTHNRYSAFDKTVRRFRDGGSFSGNFSANRTFGDRYTATGGFAYNRFANPQGSVRTAASMNFGFAAKLLQKRVTLTANFIDPFNQAENRMVTYGSNFILESVNTTNTRNYRLTVSYNLVKPPKKKVIPGAKKTLPVPKSH